MWSTRQHHLLALIQPRFIAPTRVGSRALTTSSVWWNNNPKANQPDGISRETRKDTPNTDRQSSASQEEHKTGDDHPAKQPDYQAEPTRSTGFGGQAEVRGGKEGLKDEKERRKK